MAKKIAGTSKFWWAYLVFGIIVLLVGGNFLARPTAALTTISVFLGLYLIIAGVAKSLMCIVDRKIIRL